ncbi:RHS repeat protein [Pseudomonas chlororaphis]|uniref:RHS repeat-associated core domain-containing protein n=1 Tax=Pseudomonas chlororaphis TaxID=587753 RepID=UPI002367D98A|nr:RHS repeat-associated core domain-containing protein [Pseudomonas chlororaphis]WDG77604.1 RHS repeat protein [Pseudomonas chlororaphis]WDG83159.1 RHS repeat protein [Pseudomonas chlororaphis]
MRRLAIAASLKDGLDPMLNNNPAFGTPAFGVLSNRGVPVRTLSYNRSNAADPLDERIERTLLDPLGRVVSCLDARLFTSGGTPNFAYVPSLSGRVLRTASVDAGTTLALADVEGRPIWSRDGRGTVSTWTYDVLGRPDSVTEVVAGLPLTRDVFRYGEAEPEAQAHNRRGQCVRHYDSAGRLAISGFTLNGAPLSQTRSVLADSAQAADWAGADEAAWAGALDPSAYPTAWRYGASGTWLDQTDALGNTQHQAFDVAGRLSGSALTLAGQARQPVLSAIDYSAVGQVLCETAGNGVLSSYAYEPETQRLARLTLTRPAQAGRARLLQDLHYTYDPVGNVLSVRDDAQSTTYWRNQQVEPQQSFIYDALYQLISATGRETVGRGQQGQTLPAALPLPSDDSLYTHYTRRYTYDRGGNLTRIQHSAPASQNSYTTEITVSDRSNRALPARDGLTPDQVDAQFDASGHQNALLPGLSLDWNPRGELRQVTPITRDGGVDDREWYHYGSDGMRVLKVSEQQHAGTTQRRQVLYLPGLECRTSYSGDTSSERLLVIQLVSSGHTSVRALHWTNGLPPTLSNDTLRYSHGDLIGSSLLELDQQAEICSQEAYYPYGGTAIWTARSQAEADTKTRRYSGKERDATGLYYYGFRYYQPWIGRWLSADPAGTIDGLNLFRMVDNNPIKLRDISGLSPDKKPSLLKRLFGKGRSDTEAGNSSAASIPAEAIPKPIITRPTTLEYQPSISMDPQYFGEPARGVKYFDAEERKQYAATFENGLIKYKTTGMLINEQSGPVYGDSGDWGRNMMAYVIAPDDTMYMAKHETGLIHHSSFMSGGNVRDAGMISIVNGQPLFFNAKSGHYKPSAEQKLASIDYFAEHGLDLSKVFVGPQPTSQFTMIHQTDLYRASSLRLKGMKAEPRWAPTLQEKQAFRPSVDARARLTALTAWTGTHAH